MFRVTRSVVLTLVALFGVQAIAFAAPLGDRITRDFPLVARVASLDANASAAQFSDALTLESGDARVVLRGAAKDLAVLRTGTREALILESPAARVAYDVVRTEAVEAVVGDGRGGVRFLTLRNAVGKPIGIGAALLIDADGRPSMGQWTIEKNRITLRITDRALRYPVAVVYATGEGFEETTPAKSLRQTFVAQEDAVGTISGTVTSGTNPVPDALLFIYNSAGELIEFALTDGAGNYSVAVEAGSYRMLIFAFGYQEELYNDIPCPSFSCDPADGDGIGVTAAATTVVNVDLPATLSRISGTITNTANTPLPGVLAIVYNSGGNPVTSAEADASGGYEIVLEPGTYYVASRNDIFAGLVDQLYNGNDCTGCNPTTGTALVLSTGASATANLVLKTNGGRIAGNVKDADRPEAIAFEPVTIYNTLGNAVSYGITDGSGNYISFHGLAAGSYYAVASAFLYESELYNNISCATGCVPTSGTAVSVALGATTNNIDFTLGSNANRVSGRVYNAANNTALADVLVFFYNGAGTLVASAVSLADGTYDAVLPGPGNYFAKTLNQVHAGFIDQLYNNIPCSACDVTTGTAIAVAANARTVGIDFPLSNTGGAISGRVTHSNSGTPVENATVVIYNSDGEEVSFGTTNANGDYSTFHGLAAGSYFAVAHASGFNPEAYNNVTCGAPCDPTIGTAIAVAAGVTTTGIDFTVGDAVARITGSVLTASGNAPIGGVTVQIYNSSGALVAGAISDGANGSYEALVSVSGTYYAVTHNEAGYFEELYNNISCANGCDPTTGTGITATLGSTTANINFTLEAMPVVCPIINFEPETLNNGTYGVAYSVTIIASGGQAPHTYEISAGALPPGLTLSGNVISGTPTAAGTYTFTILAKDSTGTGETAGTQCTGTKTYTLIIEKANPAITWADPAAITYGTALGGAQLNATANVAGTFVYTPPAGTILDAGTYTLSVAFTPTDTANYNNAADTATLVVMKANQTINWANPAAIVYGTPLGATQLNATVTVPGPSPHGALTYSPAAGTVLNAGTHTLSVTAAGTSNYNPATASVTLVVLKATPVFSNFSAPTIVVGTATTVVSGKIAAPTAIPPGSVSITINGVTQNPAIAADGTFSATFNSGALAVGSYPIAFSYAGDANFNPATGGSTLTVIYAVTGGPTSNNPANSGSTIPFRISLVNAAGTNVSSASIAVKAYGVRLTSSSTWIAPNTTGNSSLNFDFQNASGGSYRFNLQTTGLASGNYVLGFTVGSSPYVYEVAFGIK